MTNTQILEEFEITNNLKMSISVTLDEERVYLDVDYMDGKYKIQKIFKNNYIGLEKLSVARNQFNTEESILEYLGIKE